MEATQVGGVKFYAGKAEIGTATAQRVRRLPRDPATGRIDDSSLSEVLGGASSQITADGVVVVSRPYLDHPNELIFGRDAFSGSEIEFGSPPAASPPAHAVGPALVKEGLTPHDATTMVSALEIAAKNAGEHKGIKYVEQGTCIFESYATLRDEARKVLHALRKLGLSAGAPLAMQVTERKMHLHAVWGCALGGFPSLTVAIPPKYVAGNAVVQKLLGVIAQVDARHLLASTANVQPLTALLPSHVKLHDVASLDTSGVEPDAVPIHSAHPDDVLFFQLTSGSTGTPKCIPERHRAIISHIRHSAQQCAYTSDGVTLNWLPFDHVVPMLTYHLADVYLQRVAVQVPTAEVVGDPLLWLRTMSAHRVTHSWAPNFGFKLVAQADAAGAAAKIDLSSVQRLMNAGEQVTAEVCDAFLACTGLHPSVMQPAFGMAEVCTCMTYNSSYIGGGVGGSSTIRVLKSSLQAKVLELAPEDVPSAQCAHFMDLGPPSPGVEIRISAEKGWVLGERQVGRLQIKGPCVMGGYHNNPKANAECMLADGWFDSGDLGFLHQGRLYLTGRAKEMIICRGANYYCYEIEDSVMTVAGTLPARVAATSVYDENQGTEVLLIFFVPANPAGLVHLHSHGVVLEPLKALVGAVRSQVSSAFGLAPRHVVPVADADFHRTTSGKIQRGAFKKGFLGGVYATALSALDLALGTSDLAVPAYLTAPVMVPHRIESPAEGAAADVSDGVSRGGVSWDGATLRVLLLCASSQPGGGGRGGGGVGKELADQLTAADPAVRVVGAFGDDDWAGVQAALSDGVDVIIHALMLAPCPAGQPEPRDAKVARASLGGAVNTLADLARAIEGAGLGGDEGSEHHLTLLCLREANAPDTIGYASSGAAFAPGLCKAISAELRCVRRAAVIDIEDASPSFLAPLLLTEARGGSALDMEVAYGAGGERRVRRYLSVGEALAEEAEGGVSAVAAADGVGPQGIGSEMAPMVTDDVSPMAPMVTPLAQSPPLLRPSAAYIVTGGLGGVGLLTVKLLLDDCADARILIIGRRHEKKVSKQLRSLGPAVSYASVDLGAEPSALRGAITTFLGGSACNGRQLAGVLHLAGGYKRLVCAQLTAPIIAEHVRAKVDGAMHLHDAVASLPLPHRSGVCFVYFGSIASVYAGSGLGCYAAANDFLHAFAAYQRRECGLNARTLAWTSWKDLGISSRDKSLGFARWVESMPARVGVAIMRGLLKATHASPPGGGPSGSIHPDVLIGAKPRDPEFGCLCANGPVALDTRCVFYTRDQVPPPEVCTGAIMCCVPELPMVAADVDGPTEGRAIDMEALRERPLATLLGRQQAAPPEGPTEEALVTSWSDLLGCDVGRDDNFFDLGGSSVSWMGVVARANSSFGIKLAAMEVMEFAVLRDFAAMIDELKASGGGMGWQPKMCVERLKAPPMPGAVKEEEEEEDEDDDDEEEEEGEASKRKHVFFIHGATGTARCFKPLVALAPPDVRAYGLLDVGLAGSPDSTHLGFDELAALYASAIRATEPNGPYTLVGHGVGGEWMWATAEALQASGAEVAKLVLLDVYQPSWGGGSFGAAPSSSWLSRSSSASSASSAGGSLGSAANGLLRRFSSSLESVLPSLGLSRSSSAADTSAMTERSTRRERLASAFVEWSEAEDRVWDFSVRMQLLEGWPALLTSRAELEPAALPPRCEDAMHLLATRAKEAGIDVEAAKRAARCVAESTLRSLPYLPKPMPPSTRVILVSVARGPTAGSVVSPSTCSMGLGVDGDQPAQVIAVSLSGRASTDPCAELSAKGLAEHPGLVEHLRCLRDPAFLGAARSVVFD